MKKVLYVDDERELHPVVQGYFPKDQYRVLCASDGAEGMQKCRNEDFDLVILDFKMPKIDGAKFYVQLQDLQESKKGQMPIVIFVSGFIDELKEKDIKWNKCEFLNKPFQKEELFEKIQSVSAERTRPSIKVETKITLEPGESLFSEGDETTSMYYIVSGLLEGQTLNREGNASAIGKFGTGELIGEMAVLNGEKHIFSAVAVEKTEVIPIPCEKVMAIVNSQPKWIKLMIENLSRRLKDSIKQTA